MAISQKLADKLIRTEFPNHNPNQIWEVINATSNPDVALETLLGLYEEPDFSNHLKVYEDHCENIFISYDKWKDKVYYSYLEHKTRSGYFDKSTKVEDITVDNFAELSKDYNYSNGVSHRIRTGETSTGKTYMTAGEWLKLKVTA